MNLDYLYELGKWLGDRRGFPRVGIINTELKLVKDTQIFLKKNFNRKPIFKVITKKDNKTMFGNKAYESYIISSNLHRRLEKQTQDLMNNVNDLSQQKSLSLLAGFIDAEGTIDLKNYQVVISIGKKNNTIKDFIYKLIKNLGWEVRVWDCLKEWKLSIKTNNEMIKNLRKYIRHPKKKNLLNFNLSYKDQNYLNYIYKNNGMNTKTLASYFHIHEDSARRVLRYFFKLNKIKKVSKKRPYFYVPDKSSVS